MEEELDAYLQAVQRDGCYRTLRVLKEAPGETTELVGFTGRNGAEMGPFVRKRAESRPGTDAYAVLARSQAEGVRFVHVPRIIETYDDGRQRTVVLEYVEGSTLDELLASQGPSIGLACAVFPDLCEAVAEIHGLPGGPLIHRDLKPGNIVMAGRTAVLIDFGIARLWQENAPKDTAHFGTRPYAPPEQYGFGQTDERSDVYALGMILYRLLTGEQPRADLAGGPFRDARIPDPLRAVISRATSFDPADRFPNAVVLAAAFEGALAAQNREGAAPDKNKEIEKTGALAPLKREGAAPAAPDGQRPYAKISVLGVIWDIVLLLFMALMVAACWTIVFNAPNEGVAAMPIAFRVYIYPICIIGMTAGIVYALADRRILVRSFTAFRRQSGRRGVGTGFAIFGVFVVLFIAGMFIAVAAGFTASPSA